MNSFISHNPTETRSIGAQIYDLLSFPACVYLRGSMGAGKTTLCQAIVEAAGYQGSVTSPTYNLIHEYPLRVGKIYHMDLYRLNDPAELEFLGLQDLYDDQSLFLVEWPENAEGFLQAADYTVTIEQDTGGDESWRKISIESHV